MGYLYIFCRLAWAWGQRTYWRHVTNTMERFVRVGDAAQPQPAIGHYDAVNLPRRRLVRSELTDALLRLFGTVVNSDSVLV